MGLWDLALLVENLTGVSRSVDLSAAEAAKHLIVLTLKCVNVLLTGVVANRRKDIFLFGLWNLFGVSLIRVLYSVQIFLLCKNFKLYAIILVC
jgi:hypothetical protein